MTERANEAGSRVYAQGDVLLLPAADVARADAGPDLDHPVIPAEGSIPDTGTPSTAAR